MIKCLYSRWLVVNNNRGYTLVEIISVIAIIAVISGIFVLSFMKKIIIN